MAVSGIRARRGRAFLLALSPRSLSGVSRPAGSRRGVAQPGRVLRSGRRCRRFKSSHPDHFPSFTSPVRGLDAPRGLRHTRRTSTIFGRETAPGENPPARSWPRPRLLDSEELSPRHRAASGASPGAGERGHGALRALWRAPAAQREHHHAGPLLLHSRAPAGASGHAMSSAERALAPAAARRGRHCELPGAVRAPALPLQRLPPDGRAAAAADRRDLGQQAVAGLLRHDALRRDRRRLRPVQRGVLRPDQRALAVEPSPEDAGRGRYRLHRHADVRERRHYERAGAASAHGARRGGAHQPRAAHAVLRGARGARRAARAYLPDVEVRCAGGPVRTGGTARGRLFRHGMARAHARQVRAGERAPRGAARDRPRQHGADQPARDPRHAGRRAGRRRARHHPPVQRPRRAPARSDTARAPVARGIRPGARLPLRDVAGAPRDRRGRQCGALAQRERALRPDRARSGGWAR